MPDTFDGATSNPGVGGLSWAIDAFADGGGNTRNLMFSGLVLPDGAGYSRLSDAFAMPIKIGTGQTLPVSAASLPLPTGAATAANQATANAALASLDGKVAACDTGNVTVAASALPTGAATAANQTTGNSALASIDGKITACNTGAVTVASSALPTGAATLAEQQSQTTQLTRVAGKYVDFDTGAGNDSVVAIGLLLPGNGGAVIGGTASNPIRVDVTGSTTQPISSADLTAAAGSLNVIDDWDEADRAKVNLIVGQAGISAGAGTAAANTPRVTLASDDPAVSHLATIAAGVAITPSLADDDAFTVGSTLLSPAGYFADETATDSVHEGDVGAARMTLDRRQIVVTQPHTQGGLSMHKTISAASTNATVAKASAGQLYEIVASNKNASPRYLKLYDKSTTPTVGTDTPAWTLELPGNTSGGGLAKTIPSGLAFASGIAFALTTGIADNDTGAVSANEHAVNLGYK